MSGLLRVNQKEFDKLNEMNESEYKDFLEYKLEEAKNDSNLKRYKFITKNELFRFFVYPPFLVEEGKEEIKYIEKPEQRKVRLNLKKQYRTVYTAEIMEPFVPTTEGDIELSTLLSLLGVTRKTLYNLQDKKGENNFDMYSVKGKSYIDKNDFLQYLNARHFEATNLGFENMYTTVKNLKFNKDEEGLKEIINSKEYQEKWDKYFKTVAPEQRVYKTLETEKYNNVDIYIKEEEKDYFDIYNPNIKISDTEVTEVPKLYQASYWAAILGVVTRSVLRYCELGYLSYYKLGGKYMISAEEFNRCKENIENKKIAKKPRVGRKSRIETFLSDIYFGKESKIDFKGNEKQQKLYEKIKEFEVILSNKEKEFEKLSAKLETSDAKEKIKLNEELKQHRKEIRSTDSLLRKKKSAFLKDVIKNIKYDNAEQDTIEYYKEIVKLKGYKFDYDKAKEEGNSKLAEQLQFIIVDLENKIKNKKETIIQKILE